MDLDMGQLASKPEETTGASTTDKTGDVFVQGKFSEGGVTRNTTNIV